MFESIQGRLAVREPAACVVEAGGLGYAVQIPVSTFEGLPPVGESVRLFLHLVVREDEWRLYGFAAPEEREVFRALIRVNGVGPVMALGLLSGFQPHELASTVSRGDVRGLTRVKGIGKKTAERIVVELRDLWKDRHPGETATAAGEPSQVEDAVRALEALGLDASEAHRRVTKHLKSAGPDVEVPELVRAALRGA